MARYYSSRRRGRVTRKIVSLTVFRRLSSAQKRQVRSIARSLSRRKSVGRSRRW